MKNRKNGKSFWKELTVLLGSVGLAGTAHAYVTVQGQVSGVQAFGSAGGAPGNYDFRVFLLGNTIVCNGQNWAYVNVSDANYNVLVATALSAKASGSYVILYVTQDGNGYCQLASIVAN